MNTVYMIVNNINRKAYVGVTTQDPDQRRREHICRFRRGDRNHKLYQAMNKYGAESFSMHQICSVLDKKDLAFYEVFFIALYNTFENGYNMTPGGKVVSDETRNKISASLKGRKITWYDKILESRNANPNRKDPKEYVAKGADNSNAGTYTVMFPDGHTEVIKGLRAFCRDHNMSITTLLHTLPEYEDIRDGRGHRTYKPRHRGFALLERFNDYPKREYSQAAGSGAHPNLLSINLDNF